MIKHRVAAALALSASLFLLAPATGAQAAPALTPSLGGYVNAGDSAPFSVVLSDVVWDDAVVRITLATGTMSVDTSGLALSLQPGYPSFTAVTDIAFTGPLADVTTALADRLTWTAPATPVDSYLRLTMSVDSWVAGTSLNPANGHYYLLSSGLATWPDARDAAAGMIHDGLEGYLTTITSASENSFVTTASGGTTAWTAATTEIAYVNPLRAPADQYASNADIAGVPHWGAGPEGGLVSPYTSWFPGEPNGSATDRCMLTNWFSPTGGWNDSPCTVTYRYVVEFGGVTAGTAALSFDNLNDPAPARAGLAATGTESGLLVIAGGSALLVGAVLMLRRSGRRSY